MRENARKAQHRTCHDKLFISEQQKNLKMAATWKKRQKVFKMIWRWRVLFSPMPARKIFPPNLFFYQREQQQQQKNLDRLTKKKDVSGRFSDFTLFLSIWGAKWKINNEQFMYTFFWQCLKSFCASFKPFFFSFHHRDLNSNSQFMMKSFSTRLALALPSEFLYVVRQFSVHFILNCSLEIPWVKESRESRKLKTDGLRKWGRTDKQRREKCVGRGSLSCG